jgi:hypothetical protein
VPVAFLFALKDRSGLVRPEVDFNSQITAIACGVLDIHYLEFGNRSPIIS